MDIICSKCNSEIGKNDFNISTDLAYCSFCDLGHKLSDLVNYSNLMSVDITKPIKYVKTTKNGYDGELIYKRVPRLLFILIPFTCIWSGVSMTMVIGLFWEKGLTIELLFFIPFLLGTFILISIILFGLFGKSIISFDRDRVRIFTGIFGIGLRREFKKINYIKIIKEIFYYNKNQNKPKYRLAINLKNNQLLKCGLGINNEDLDYIATYINKIAKSKSI